MENTALFLILLPVLCLAYHDTCIPDCVQGAKAPNAGGAMCRCTHSVPLPGCQVSPCKPGEDSDKEYTCSCTPENKPEGCVNPRCNNSTLSVTDGDESQTASVDSLSCNKLCKCRAQPADCTKSSVAPGKGGPPCTCTPDNWISGCTMKPCKRGDNHDLYWFCECTKDFCPDFGYTPICKSLLG